MFDLTGEYICKLDAKFRMAVPAALKRKIPNIEQDGLVINKGFEKNLTIYPKSEWLRIMRQLNQLNQFKLENRNFIRKFTNGANELALDASGRILIPKNLLEYAKIEGELILACQLNKIEVWSQDMYDEIVGQMGGDEFADLGEKVMGGFNFGEQNS